jgi:hypothetical protein
MKSRFERTEWRRKGDDFSTQPEGSYGYASTAARQLEEVLALTKGRHVSDPRDLIFSILGLIPADLSEIGPDYTKSVKEVFVDVAHFMFKADNTLGLLDLASYVPYSEIPSWVQDWRVDGRAKPFSVRPHDVFRSALGLSYEYKEVGQRNLLKVRGFQCDVIEEGIEISDELPDTEETYNKFVNYLQATARYTEQAKAYVGLDEKTYFNAVYTTQFADLHPFSNRYTEEMKCALGLSKSCAWVRDHPGRPLGEDEAVWKETMHHVRVRCRTLKILLTGNHFMGLGRKEARPGDIVCILLGAGSPIILRQDGDAYFHIGSCYIHGIMDGEAMEKTTHEGFEYEDFILK